jgi:hypothetical protein
MSATASKGSGQVDGVVDLTFLDLRNDTELATKLNEMLNPPADPVASSSGKTAALSTVTVSPDSPSRKAKKKSEIKAVRLGNNLLANLESIYVIPQQINSMNILWLDLSFNEFTRIPADFGRQFPNVSTIYLHANKISKLSEIKNLANFEQLRSLSLFGNPVEENKHYRNYVLYYCKHLTQFDKSPVTKSQREKVNKELCLLDGPHIFFTCDATFEHRWKCGCKHTAKN